MPVELKNYKKELLDLVSQMKEALPQDFESKNEIPKANDRAKLNPSQYDLRLSFYRAAKKFILAVIGKADVTVEELREYGSAIDESIFAFDPEISVYLREIYEKAIEFRLLQKRISSPTGPGNPKFDVWLDRDEELLLWFTRQLDELRTKMYPFIGV
jgi:hypothetical protein